MQRRGGTMIDCQLETPHLKSMGGRFIPYEQYLEILNPHGLEQLKALPCDPQNDDLESEKGEIDTDWINNQYINKLNHRFLSDGLIYVFVLVFIE